MGFSHQEVQKNLTLHRRSFRMQSPSRWGSTRKIGGTKHEGDRVKDFLIELAEARLQELEWKEILPKNK
jgi:hypothetical protein